jgi:bacterioferritin
MGIDAFKQYIQKCDDYNIKNQLQEIQEDYRLHALKVSERILDLGGVPANSSGLAYKTIDSYSQIANNINLNSSQDIIEEAHNTSNTGYIIGTRLIQESKSIDHISYRLLNSILKDYQRHMNSLSKHPGIH